MALVAIILWENPVCPRFVKLPSASDEVLVPPFRLVSLRALFRLCHTVLSFVQHKGEQATSVSPFSTTTRVFERQVPGSHLQPIQGRVSSRYGHRDDRLASAPTSSTATTAGGGISTSAAQQKRTSPYPQSTSPVQPSLRLICISDTHNLRPQLPQGDLLIHAGDLTEWGTFTELQSQLTWLSSQPHAHKLLVAGNHDLLLDEAFLHNHPEHRDPRGRTKHDLDFGSITYLQDQSTTLSFPERDRVLHVYGSPWTPRYGTSAFQYSRDTDVWTGRVPDSTDVLVTHGPPAGFKGIKPSAGCADLRREVARVKPRLVAFGHIHAARGEQTVTFDAAQSLYDGIVEGSGGWLDVPLLALAVVWGRIGRFLGCSVRSTRMVNAAVVDGMKKDVALEAFVVDL